MTQTATFQELLGRFPAFRDLGDERLAWLAQRSRPFVCPVGQELLVQDRMPDHCFCVVEGRGRLLHDDPGLRRPVTLALSQPGDLVGWAGLVRRSPCEWVTASTPLKLIGFSDETFYELERESEAFSRWLDSNDSPAELITALAPALRRRPKAEPPEREVLRHLLPGLRVIAAHSLRRLPDDGAVWLWDSQPSDEPVSIGAEVDPERLAAIPAGEPLRLLRIERDLWSRELNPDLQPPDQLEVPTSVDLWSQDRYSDLSVPDPQGERHPTELSKGAQATESTPRFRGRSIPVVTGIGGQQQAMACLEMLARFYNAPFRRDVMERSVRQSLATVQSVWKCSAILL